MYVSQRTLVDWNRQLAPDIRALRAVHLEALHEQTLAISSLRSWRLCVLIAHPKASASPHPAASLPSHPLSAPDRLPAVALAEADGLRPQIKK